MAYAMGAVRPYVADQGNQIGEMFAVPTIGGWRATAGDPTGHPAGLALDFQFGNDRAKGDAIAAYVTANAAALNVKYVCWQQRIWYPGKSWAPMEFKSGDKPGYDPNHMRHVHVSFLDVKGQTPANKVPAAGNYSGGGAIDWAKGIFTSGTGAVVGLVGGVVDGAGNIVGDVAGAAGDVVDAALAPAEALAKLFDRTLWLRILQIGGGFGLVIYGLVILAVSSGAGPAANIASLVPAPQAQAAGAVLKGVNKVTKGS